ncbi:MAG: hypothetical protein ACI89X_003235 [Planctomycetota bacterium]|jgi:hypothetical protein
MPITLNTRSQGTFVQARRRETARQEVTAFQSDPPRYLHIYEGVAVSTAT